MKAICDCETVGWRNMRASTCASTAPATLRTSITDTPSSDDRAFMGHMLIPKACALTRGTDSSGHVRRSVLSCSSTTGRQAGLAVERVVLDPLEAALHES